MRNFKLTIEYDGSEFHGWQVQPDLRTVQGELGRALHELCGKSVKIIGAGRTDAGVHATGQVANVKFETRLEASALARALNASLPHDILIRKAEEVRLSFNARFDAQSRTYHYIFSSRPTALWRRYFYYYPGTLDVSAMRRALRLLIGERDFGSFCSRDDTCKTKICRVINADIVESPPLLTFRITADHFLHTMVRSLAGTLLDVGLGKPRDMERIIGERDRAAAGRTLPPHGLYLVNVGYGAGRHGLTPYHPRGKIG
jgi:tRNA pseudouridine38-40 synthase